MNNITTENQENCVANANVQVSGNVIIVSGSTVSGNVGTVTGVSTDASCLMVSAMENNIQDIMRATSTQTNNTSNDWFGGFQWNKDNNSFNLTQSVTNNINQINELTCTANSMATNSNNYIYVSGSSVGGNVGVASSTNAAANCSMSNMMKNYSYNYVQGDNNQSNTQKGMFVAIVAAICTLIGIIIIGVVILFAVGAIGFTGYELVSPKNPTPAAGVDQSTDISSDLSNLGLSATDINSLDAQINNATPTISNITPQAVSSVHTPSPNATPVANIKPIGVGRAETTPTIHTTPTSSNRLVQAGNSLLASTGQKISEKATTLGSSISQKVNRAGSSLSQKAEDFASRSLSKVSAKMTR